MCIRICLKPIINKYLRDLSHLSLSSKSHYIVNRKNSDSWPLFLYLPSNWFHFLNLKYFNTYSFLPCWTYSSKGKKWAIEVLKVKEKKIKINLWGN